MTWADYPIFRQDAYRPLLDELHRLQDALSLAKTEMAVLAARVSDRPMAATVLLQLLQHNEQCVKAGADEAALVAESLAYSTLQSGQEFRRWLSSRSVAIDPSRDLRAPLLLGREGNALRIRLHRPQARNAYSAAMRDALYEALQLLDADDSIEYCYLDGAGDCFCVGGDLAEFGQATDPAMAHVIRMTRCVPALLLRHAARIECQVHRACIGSGIELPAFARRLVATADTFFQLPELSMGLIPGAGGTVSILKRIGRYRLAWWVLSGRRITAETALAWGLVDAVSPAAGRGNRNRHP